MAVNMAYMEIRLSGGAGNTDADGNGCTHTGLLRQVTDEAGDGFDGGGVGSKR